MGRGITLAPCGLAIERIETEADKLLIVARPVGATATCPACGTKSARIHSRYQRSLTDLPSQGRRVVVAVSARRFRCVVTDCAKRIFAERLETTVGGPFARRTARLEGIVHHLGLALGGRAGQSFTRRLLLPVSNDTLLRVVRRRMPSTIEQPRVVGIDDWATLAKVPTAKPLECQWRDGSVVIATERSFATWSDGALSIFCLIGKPRR
jgi:transposase